MQNTPPQDELQERLWELVYELLPDDEAEALCRRVTSEPDVARAYARVKLQSEIIAAAARIDESPIALPFPGEKSGRRAEQPAARGAGDSVRRAESLSVWARSLNWAVGVAAVLLFGFVGLAYLRISAPAAPTVALADQPFRAIVTRPAVLHTDVANPLTVRTESLDGSPLSTELELRVYNRQGRLLLSDSKATDDDGLLRVELPGDKLSRSARFEIRPRDGGAEMAVATNLDVVPGKHLTYLAVDKPFYRRGETVLYRSLSLSRFDLRAERELDVDFELRDAAGRPVPGSQVSQRTEWGVASGSFSIPADMDGGKYALVASSPMGEFSEQQREFLVRQYELPIFNKRLTLERDSYGPNDEVVADILVQREDGDAAAGTRLSIDAFVDGQPLDVPAPQAVTDEQGAYRLRFRLPEAIRRGEGMITVEVGDQEQRERIAKSIPINLGEVQVEFYPEAGELVAGLPNRVYFHAHDPLGRPVHVEGAIVDSTDSELAGVETRHEGRGRFAITPEAGQTYTLRIDRPLGGHQLELPGVAPGRELVLRAAAGVFEAGAAVDVDLYTARPLGPIVVSASCRGAVVGLLRIEPGQFERVDEATFLHRAAMAVAAEAAGVIRLTAYDYGGSTPRPLAERLVFRRPTQKLEITTENLADAYTVGEAVDVSFVTTDEDRVPRAAVLGLSAVDESLLQLADDKSPYMQTYYYLTTEIENPQDLEDANYFLSDQEGAAEALDLLLGTQGWRRFVAAPWGQLALDRPALADELATVPEASTAIRDEQLQSRLAALGDDSAPPVSLAQVISPRPVPSFSTLGQPDSADISRLGLIALLGGGGLLLALIMLGLLRRSSGPGLWIPTAVLATASAVVGVMVLAPQGGWTGNVAVAPDAPVATGEAHLAADSAGADEPDAAAKDIAGGTPEPARQLGLMEQMQAEGEEPAEAATPAAPMPEPAAEDEQSRPPADSEEAVRPRAEEPPAARARAPESRAATAPQLNEEKQEQQKKMLAPDQAAAAAVDRSEVRGGQAAAAKSRGAAGELFFEELQEARSNRADSRFFREYGFRRSLGRSLEAAGQVSETIFWAPYLLTDADGRVTVRFNLPASGVYRLRVDGHADGRLGSTEARIVSQ